MIKSSLFLIFMSLFGSLIVSANPIQNTLSEKFLQAVRPISNKVFSGTTPEGKDCSVLVKSVLNLEVPGYFHISSYISYNVVAINGEIPQAVVAAQDSHQLDKASADWNDAIPAARIIKYAQAGWCDDCGSRHDDGRVSFTGRQLEFYAAGEIPRAVQATIDLTSDKMKPKRVRFWEYENWYVPAFRWSPRDVSFECIVNY